MVKHSLQTMTLTPQEQLRRASQRLQRHIFHQNSVLISQTIQNTPLLSFSLQVKYNKLLRQIRKDHNRIRQKKKILTVSQSGNQKVQNDEKSQQNSQDQLQNQQNAVSQSQESAQVDFRGQNEGYLSHNSTFQELIAMSKRSYQKTNKIFKGLTLKQKYGHLLQTDLQQPRENIREGQVGSQILNNNAEQSNRVRQSSQLVLSREQQKSLQRLRALYKKYRVSNMFKSSLCLKIKKKYIQSLISKGYLSQKQNIISLCS